MGECFGEAFVIHGNHMGWYTGLWLQENGSHFVMIRPINDEDFVFFTLDPKKEDALNPFVGIMQQTWYASLQGVCIEIAASGAQILLNTKSRKYDHIPIFPIGTEILVRNQNGEFRKQIISAYQYFENGICILYKGKFQAEEYVPLEEYEVTWKRIDPKQKRNPLC